MSEKKYRQALEPYLPQGTASIIAGWLQQYRLRVVLWEHRVTKRGDFRASRHPGERNSISINISQNPYSFLITIVHEIAHAVVYEQYRRRVKPHGPEWQNEYRRRMLVFLNNRLFPKALEGPVAWHLRKPKASVAAEPELEKVLRQYDENPPENRLFLDDLDEGEFFMLDNGRVFRKLEKRRTRHTCIEVSSGRKYSVAGLAEVQRINPGTHLPK